MKKDTLAIYFLSEEQQWNRKQGTNCCCFFCCCFSWGQLPWLTLAALANAPGIKQGLAERIKTPPGGLNYKPVVELWNRAERSHMNHRSEPQRERVEMTGQQKPTTGYKDLYIGSNPEDLDKPTKNP